MWYIASCLKVLLLSPTSNIQFNFNYSTSKSTHSLHTGNVYIQLFYWIWTFKICNKLGYMWDIRLNVQLCFRVKYFTTCSRYIDFVSDTFPDFDRCTSFLFYYSIIPRVRIEFWQRQIRIPFTGNFPYEFTKNSTKDKTKMSSYCIK